MVTLPVPALLGVLAAIEARRVTREFTPTAVDDEAIDALLRAAMRAPTAVYAEPWAFVVVQDRDLLRTISDHAKALAELPSAPASARTAKAPCAAAHMFPPAFNIFYNAGTLIVICSRSPGPFGAADCWLAAANLMLAATARGLGACPIGFAIEALQAVDLKRDLGIPEELRAVAAVIVGDSVFEVPEATRREPHVLRWLREPRPPAPRAPRHTVWAAMT
jgi:nitroreductase